MVDIKYTREDRIKFYISLVVCFWFLMSGFLQRQTIILIGNYLEEYTIVVLYTRSKKKFCLILYNIVKELGFKLVLFFFFQMKNQNIIRSIHMAFTV